MNPATTMQKSSVIGKESLLSDKWWLLYSWTDWLGFDAGYLPQVGLLLTILNPFHLCRVKFFSCKWARLSSYRLGSAPIVDTSVYICVTAKSRFKEL